MSFFRRGSTIVATHPCFLRGGWHEPGGEERASYRKTPFFWNFGKKAGAGSLVGPQLIFGRLLDMIDDEYVVGELCRSHL